MQSGCSYQNKRRESVDAASSAIKKTKGPQYRNNESLLHKTKDQNIDQASLIEKLRLKQSKIDCMTTLAPLTGRSFKRTPLRLNAPLPNLKVHHINI